MLITGDLGKSLDEITTSVGMGRQVEGLRKENQNVSSKRKRSE
jgi:hypothetical protein